MSEEELEFLTNLYAKLDECAIEAETTTTRVSHAELMQHAREIIAKGYELSRCNHQQASL